MRLPEALSKLREGVISFQQFWTLTRQDWDKMAGKLFRRWQLPCGVSEDDVVQEMLLAAWRCAVGPIEKGGWDPSRGIPLSVHVVWNAHTSAKKWLHQQRKAKRRDDSAPSRHPLAASAVLSDKDGESGMSEMLDQLSSKCGLAEVLVDMMDDREDLAEEGKRSLRLLRRQTGKGNAALSAWLRAGCDAGRAAELWYGDPQERLRYRLECEEHAERVIRAEVKQAGDQFIGRCMDSNQRGEQST